VSAEGDLRLGCIWEPSHQLSGRVQEALPVSQTQLGDFGLKALDKELISMMLIWALPDEYSHFVSSLLLMDKLDKDTV
jgi:hypothetical protein